MNTVAIKLAKNLRAKSIVSYGEREAFEGVVD